MSDENELLDEPFEEVKGGGGGKVMMIMVLLVGLGGGGFVGTTLLGDTMGPILLARAQSAAEGGGGGGGHGAPADDGHGGGGGAGVTSTHVVENVVVNPARSGGNRFLLTSIAIEAIDPGLVDVIAQHEVEIRSALLMVLGAKTTDELGVEHLEAITHEVEAKVIEILGPGVVSRVFIPQFVIQ